MSSPSVAPSATAVVTSSPRSNWFLWGSAAGALGLAATLLDSRPPGESTQDSYTITPPDMASLNPAVFHVALVAGYLCVACLLVFAGLWRRNVELRFPGSASAPIVHAGVVASAGTLALAYGWKGALGLYLDGGPESGAYDDSGRFVYWMLSDFSPYVGWLGVCFAGMALGWMAWLEGLVTRGLGTVSAALNVLMMAATFVFGVPGLPFAAALVLVITGVWLRFGRSPITRGDLA
jgi:hypothetical protein